MESCTERTTTAAGACGQEDDGGGDVQAHDNLDKFEGMNSICPERG